MQSPQEFLLALGIKLASYGVGTHQTTCPKCSANRQKRLAKCLTVRIGSDRIYGGCNHCGWTFPEPGSAKGSRPDNRIYHLYPNGNRKVRNRGGTPPCAWQHQDADGSWVKGSKDLPSDALYRYDEVIKILQEHPATLIAIAEGESDVDALWSVGIPATCNAHGASETGKRPKWTVAHSKSLGGARLCVFNDNDGPGYAHADAIVKCSTGISQEVRRLDLKDHWPEIGPGGDVRDFLNTHDFVELIQLMDKAPIKANGHAPEHIAKADDPEIDRLAQLSWLEYGQQREGAAERLGIKVVSYLDKAVDARRRQLRPHDENRSGQEFKFEEPEPWLEEIHTADLLNELERGLRRFAITTDDYIALSVLFAPLSYVYRSFRRAPRLEIRAPSMNCGKSQILDWLNVVAYRPMPSGNMSAASFFRLVEQCHPTMLIDEVDSFANEDSEIRNVLINGYSPNGYIVRCEKIGDRQVPSRFSCYGVVAFAHIGVLPWNYRQLVSRSIKVHMERKLAHEQAEIAGEDHYIEFLDVRRKLMRWANDNRDVLKKSNPAFPSEITDGRIRNRFQPLLAIADLAGEAWGKRVRAAMIDNIKDELEDLPRGERLLKDMWEILIRLGSPLPASVMYEEIRQIDYWKEVGKARKPITDVAIAKLLWDTFRIKSTKTSQANNFTIEALREKHSRYLSPLGTPSTLHPSTTMQNQGLSETASNYQNDPQVIENEQLWRDGGSDPPLTLHNPPADDLAAWKDEENQGSGNKQPPSDEDDPDAFF